MSNPIMVLPPKDRQIVLMILTMLDGKTIGETCDILDVVNFYVNSTVDINFDDRIFYVDKVKDKILGGLQDDSN